jgi:hypothetical protein
MKALCRKDDFSGQRTEVRGWGVQGLGVAVEVLIDAIINQEMADRGSDQGRRVIEPAGEEALWRGAG